MGSRPGCSRRVATTLGRWGDSARLGDRWGDRWRQVEGQVEG